MSAGLLLPPCAHRLAPTGTLTSATAAPKMPAFPMQAQHSPLQARVAPATGLRAVPREGGHGGHGMQSVLSTPTSAAPSGERTQPLGVLPASCACSMLVQGAPLCVLTEASWHVPRASPASCAPPACPSALRCSGQRQPRHLDRRHCRAERDPGGRGRAQALRPQVR